MIITGDDSASIRSLQHFLSQHFEMKDLGTFSYFLGLEVTSSSDGYYLSQANVCLGQHPFLAECVHQYAKGLQIWHDLPL